MPPRARDPQDRVARRTASLRRYDPRGARPLSANGVGRKRLLAAAASLFRRTGYSAATTRELARILGIRSASLYYHIGKKEDLLYEISVDGLETILGLVSDSLRDVIDPLDRIRTLIRTHVTTALADLDQHFTMLVEMKSLSAARRRRIIALRDRYETVIRGVVADAQARGAVRKDMPAKYLSLALLNMLNWSIFWFRRGRQLGAAELGDLFASLFIEGAAKKSGRSRRKSR